MASLIESLVDAYRVFYRCPNNKLDSDYETTRPLMRALEIIDQGWPAAADDLELTIAGALYDDLEQYPRRRALLDAAIDEGDVYDVERAALLTFAKRVVHELFEQQYRGERATAREERDRLRKAADFAYRKTLIVRGRPRAVGADERFELRLPSALLTRLDAARGTYSRAEVVRLALEAWLLANGH